MRARVVVLVGAVLGLGGCGAAEDRAEPVVQAPVQVSVPVEQTVWQLVGVRQAGVTVPTRPNLNVTLVVQPAGTFLLRACNNIFGDVVLGKSTAMFDGGTGTRRVCPGAAAEVDEALRSALVGEVAWEQVDRSLVLTNVDHDVRLDFRVKDRAQPPTSAVRVASVAGSIVGCRIMAGRAEAGDRLYALAQTRPGGPWRLVRGGPAAPGDAPLLAPELLNRATGQTCTAGFAPVGATRVEFQPGESGPTEDLGLHRVPGIEAPIYTGVVASGGSAEPGRVRAYDAAGRVLAVWFLLP